MRFGIPAGSDPTTLGTGSSNPEPGRYHVAVQDVDDTFERSHNSIMIEFQVLAPAAAMGKEFREYIYWQDPPEIRSVERLSRILWACGLLEPGVERDLNPRDAIGCQLVCEVEANEYEKDGKKKKTVQLRRDNGGSWPIGHDLAKDVDIHRAAQPVAKKAQSPGARAPTAQQANEFAGL